MRIPSRLKRAALAAFRNGGDWSQFVDQHGHEIKQAEPHDVSPYPPC